MSIFLQAEGYTGELWWILGALIVLGIVFYLTKRAQYTQRAKHLKNSDPYQEVVNDTSYNINQEGIDGHRSDDLTAEQAQRTTENMKDGGRIPSDEEYHDLKDDTKKDR
ncbi:hypothetical protein [Neolewinella litorea]|uniref:Uncharacterized protein n=1 Tax=Neolewinella litorea TaxID=2562452 RepID=A0A4S4NMW6_9BACT|nr:hypothetical protein [Neolewinella litorea]THH41296.1 hypothetical protein E4021_01480 [Neolewinella litorea]